MFYGTGYLSDVVRIGAVNAILDYSVRGLAAEYVPTRFCSRFSICSVADSEAQGWISYPLSLYTISNTPPRALSVILPPVLGHITILIFQP